MNQFQVITSLNQLMQQDASYVESWLKNIWHGQLEAPEDFNWLGLAEAATFKAHSDSNEDFNAANLMWAEVATSVYERLAAESSSPESESFVNSAMMLRVAMITRFGSISEHDVLDINFITRWFFSSLDMSYDEVNEKAHSWQTCSINDIRKLRQIKNKLSVLSVLSESDLFQLNEELSAWLALRKKLP